MTRFARLGDPRQSVRARLQSALYYARKENRDKRIKAPIAEGRIAALGLDALVLPYDTSAAFQDSNGITDVAAADDPIALFLGKEQMGGQTLNQFLSKQTEILPANVNGSETLTGWSTNGGTLSIVSGRYQFDVNNGANFCRYDVTAVPGRTYYFSFNYEDGTMAARRLSVFDLVNLGDIVPVTSFSAGAAHAVFTAPAGCTSVAIYPARDTGVTGTCFFDSVSVKEIPTTVFRQTASNDARPLFGTDGTYQWMRGDGVDDYLETAGDWIEGSDFTIIAAIRPSVVKNLNYFAGTGPTQANRGLHVGYLNASNAILGQWANDFSVARTQTTSAEVFEVIRTSSGRSIWVNGSEVGGDSNTVLLGAVDQFRIMQGFPLNMAHFQGDLYGLVAVGRELSVSERSLCRQFLAGISPATITGG